MMLRIYGLLIVLGLLAGIGYGAYYYYNDTQQRLATLRDNNCLLYTSPSPRDRTRSRMPSSA